MSRFFALPFCKFTDIVTGSVLFQERLLNSTTGIPRFSFVFSNAFFLVPIGLILWGLDRIIELKHPTDAESEIVCIERLGGFPGSVHRVGNGPPGIAKDLILLQI